MTRFLNVDLELVALENLSPLIQELGRSIFVLRDSVDEGRRTVWLELAGGNPIDANDAIMRLVALVRSLPDDTRQLRNGCADRCFNVGIEADAAPHAAAFSIARDTVAAIAAVGARLEITVYGCTASFSPTAGNSPTPR